MAVTSHHYSLPLRSIVKQGYSPSVQTPDPVETSTLWLTGDLRVCSLCSWDTTSLPIQVPTSLHPSLPAHQKTHTHTSIIFSPFDVYFIYFFLFLFCCFFFNFILFLNFTILHWLCQTSKWIHHRHTRAPHPEPHYPPPHTITPGWPSAPGPSI